MRSPTLRSLRACLLVLGVAWAAVTPVRAADDGISTGRRFQERDGASLYRAICQGCHMADGRGARGAGAYPALADNPRVAIAPYLIATVMRGRNGMPPFGAMLDDEQVAAVASHVRTHFGNRFVEPISAADVQALR